MKKSMIHFIHYALYNRLIDVNQIDDSLFRISQALHVPTVEYVQMDFDDDEHADLGKLIDIAFEKSLIQSNSIEERDAFEALLFDCVMPSPKEVKSQFKKLFNIKASEATKYLYKLSKDVNYIKTNRLKNNISWTHDSKYGKLQLTINLAKPEKDPKEIAAQKKDDPIKNLNLSQPVCVICKENEQNYHNARMNLRIVPLELGNETWHFQYSPYLYFNEHAIILHDQHRPMCISDKTFAYLLDFEDQFPTYFLGANADLPIVGGSILNHDHFQGGRHQFPIQDARPIKTFGTLNYVTISHLNWPMSTIRLSSDHRKELEEVASFLLESWKNYKNETLDILPFTLNEPHNTITPIARKSGTQYELDLILRNNRTSKLYPFGIFHPHEDVHHIKKENIGLIEAMGLAILPGRLKHELNQILEWLNQKGQINEELNAHEKWMIELSKSKQKSYTEAWLLKEVGKRFEKVIEQAGVFKLNDSGNKALHQFITDSIKKYTKTK